MATITYTATAPNGDAYTRSSGTMAYTHALVVADHGADNWGVWSWHKTPAAAYKAAQSGYHQTHHRTAVVEAVPTAVNGKANVGDFEGHPSAAAIDALIEAKAAGKGNLTPKDAMATGGNAGGREGTPTNVLRTTKAATKGRPAAATTPQALTWTEAKGSLQAKGDRHVYRVAQGGNEFYASQRGLNGSWTAIAGACATAEQAQELAQRFENGERKLGHKALRGVAYADLPAAS